MTKKTNDPDCLEDEFFAGQEGTGHLHCYHVSPIDWFAGVLTREQATASLVERFSADADEADVVLDRLTDNALRGFRLVGWEGDGAEHIGFFAVPCPAAYDFMLGCVVKQNNNGSTFIATPFQMDWLKRSSMIGTAGFCVIKVL